MDKVIEFFWGCVIVFIIICSIFDIDMTKLLHRVQHEIQEQNISVDKVKIEPKKEETPKEASKSSW